MQQLLFDPLLKLFNLNGREQIDDFTGPLAVGSRFGTLSNPLNELGFCLPFKPCIKLFVEQMCDSFEKGYQYLILVLVAPRIESQHLDAVIALKSVIYEVKDRGFALSPSAIDSDYNALRICSVSKRFRNTLSERPPMKLIGFGTLNGSIRCVRALWGGG